MKPGHDDVLSLPGLREAPDYLLSSGVHEGYLWAVCKDSMGFRCGYFRVWEGHPWHGLDFGHLELPGCHGGLTFAMPAAGTEEDPDGGWWMGFDCLHYGDAPDPALAPPDLPKVLRHGNVRSQAYVEAECRRLCERASGAVLGMRPSRWRRYAENYRHLEAHPRDWAFRLVLSDWLEEQGYEDLAGGQRWQERHGKWPAFYDWGTNPPPGDSTRYEDRWTWFYEDREDEDDQARLDTNLYVALTPTYVCPNEEGADYLHLWQAESDLARVLARSPAKPAQP